eukprot:TRINITY_DN7053_c0_g1_i3.p1 TRINITY_DN7053_c0_g1~~TRINITY_DN7053_c0_g1_i3.p1  ORF type:complete len:102 (+),score=27.29 TRINITY_DN7053_c0_g1_i3:658-963(+)
MGVLWSCSADGTIRGWDPAEGLMNKITIFTPIKGVGPYSLNKKTIKFLIVNPKASDPNNKIVVNTITPSPQLLVYQITTQKQIGTLAGGNETTIGTPHAVK